MDFGRITVNIYDKLIKEAKGGHDSRFMMYEDKNSGNLYKIVDI